MNNFCLLHSFLISKPLIRQTIKLLIPYSRESRVIYSPSPFGIVLLDGASVLKMICTFVSLEKKIGKILLSVTGISIFEERCLAFGDDNLNQ